MNYQTFINEEDTRRLIEMRERINAKFNMGKFWDPEQLWGFVGQEALARILGLKSNARVFDHITDKEPSYDVDGYEVKTVHKWDNLAVNREQLDGYPDDLVIVQVKVFGRLPDGGHNCRARGWVYARDLKPMRNDPRLTNAPGVLLNYRALNPMETLPRAKKENAFNPVPIGQGPTSG